MQYVAGCHAKSGGSPLPAAFWLAGGGSSNDMLGLQKRNGSISGFLEGLIRFSKFHRRCVQGLCMPAVFARSSISPWSLDVFASRTCNDKAFPGVEAWHAGRSLVRQSQVTHLGRRVGGRLKF